MAYEIKQNLTNTNYSSRGTRPSWIVIHNTSNSTSREGTAYNNTQYFKNEVRNASATYFVDDGDTIWQCVKDTDTAWHCGDSASRNGCYNTNSIGIEVCEPSEGKFTDHEIEVLQWLVPMLMNKYGIDENHICRHHDVTGKICPWYYSNDAHWAELKSQILEGKTIDEDEEEDMACIFQPNGESYLVYYDGSECHPLAHPDEVTAINMVYQNTHNGKSIPSFALGTENVPWAARFMEAVKRVA